MAQPITFKAARERFQLPATVSGSRVGPPDPGDMAGPMPAATAVALPDPEELLAMAVEQERARLGQQAAQHVLPQAEPQTEQNAAILDLVGPQGPPEMAKPPSLHTPEEIQAGIGDPLGPPTLSRPPADRGEAPMPPDTGQEPPSKLQQFAKILLKGLEGFDAVARGAAAGEKAGSFLGGWGAASEADRRRTMQDEAFQSDQRASATRSARQEAETRALPEEMEMRRQNQEVLQFQRQKQAEYMEQIKQRIAQQMRLEPEKMRLDQLNVFARMAADKAREETQRMMITQGRALSPEDAALKLEQAETQQAMQEYYGAGVELRGAQAGHERALEENVGSPTTTQGVRMPSPMQIRKDIMAVQDGLRNRYMDKFGKVNEAAMKQDPDFTRLADLEELYTQSLRLYKGQPETGAGGGLPQGSPSPFQFDPNRIRQRAQQMMGGAGAR